MNNEPLRNALGQFMDKPLAEGKNKLTLNEVTGSLLSEFSPSKVAIDDRTLDTCLSLLISNGSEFPVVRDKHGKIKNEDDFYRVMRKTIGLSNEEIELRISAMIRAYREGKDFPITCPDNREWIKRKSIYLDMGI